MFDVVQKGNSEIVAFKADLWFVPYLLYYIAMTYSLHIQMLQWLLHIVKTWECGSFSPPSVHIPWTRNWQK